METGIEDVKKAYQDWQTLSASQKRKLWLAYIFCMPLYFHLYKQYIPSPSQWHKSRLGIYKSIWVLVVVLLLLTIFLSLTSQ